MTIFTNTKQIVTMKRKPACSKPLLATGVDKITKHYNESKSKYDVEGESHLEYYKQKYPENYNLLKQNYDKYNK
jgi:hypothetical protein